MKVEQLIPEVYYRDSRDFAFVARCFEVIFNYMKSGAQCVNVNYLTDAIDSTIIELMADTVGFNAKHKYDSKNLLAIAGSFQNLLRNKGSMYAVELAVTILMNAQKISSKNRVGPICEIDPDDPFNILIYIPERLLDIVLLEDIFDYILPAGVTYKLLRTSDDSNKIIDRIEDKESIVKITVSENTSIAASNSNEIEQKELNVAQIVSSL